MYWHIGMESARTQISASALENERLFVFHFIVTELCGVSEVCNLRALTSDGNLAGGFSVLECLLPVLNEDITLSLFTRSA